MESRIQASLERLWDATQQPDQNQRWDVRFGSISHLPRVDGEPQRFTYATTLAPGLTVAGTGESLGDRDRADGTRWSGLKFRALADPTRRQILQDLRDSKMTAGGIASQFPISGPSISRQLSILNVAGLVTERARPTASITPWV